MEFTEEQKEIMVDTIRAISNKAAIPYMSYENCEKVVDALVEELEKDV